VPRYPLQNFEDNWFGEYRIEAFNAAGATSSARQRVQHEFSLAFDVGGLQVQSLSGTSVELSWNTDARSQSQRLTVMQSINQNSFFYERFAWMSPTQSSMTLDNLIPGQRYSFAVSGITPAGNRSTSVAFTMPTMAVPTASNSLTATTNSPTTANLTWQDSLNESGYRVYRLAGSQRLLLGTLPAETTQFPVSGLTPRTEYRFVVEAFNAAGAASMMSSAITPVTIDVNGDTQTTATPLGGPGVTATAIDRAGDIDVFSFQAEAGLSYTFATTLSSLPVALHDSVIELTDAQGRRLAYNDDFGGTLASRISWTAEPALNGQQIFLSVRGYAQSQVGDYSLSLSIVRPPVDDHGDTIASATRIQVPSALNASLQRPGDVDMFSIVVEPGTTYVFSTSLGTQSGSLRDSVLELLDSSGRRLAFNDDFGGTLASRISWTVPQGFGHQNVFLAARAYSSSQTGTYSVSVSQSVPPVVTTNSQPDVAAVTVGSQTIGQISTGGASSRYRLDVEAGQRLVIQTQLLTLRDSVITIFNSRGQRLAFNDDYGRTLASLVTVIATERDTWFIEVRAYAVSQTGTFRLLVHQI